MQWILALTVIDARRAPAGMFAGGQEEEVGSFIALDVLSDCHSARVFERAFSYEHNLNVDTQVDTMTRPLEKIHIRNCLWRCRFTIHDLVTLGTCTQHFPVSLALVPTCALFVYFKSSSFTCSLAFSVTSLPLLALHLILSVTHTFTLFLSSTASALASLISTPRPLLHRRLD